ncbi:MAG: TylF/MycF/NovP-related O-methyltransferase [Anaerolineae bacterium]
MLRKLGSAGRRAITRFRTGVCNVIWPSLRFNEDGLATEHDAPFLRDPRFLDAYGLGRGTGSWRGREVRWRAYIACWAAEWAKHLEGDFVECGVFRGGLSRAIVHYIDLNSLNKRFYLLDTFEGIPAESINEEERRQGRRPGLYEDCFADVQATFAAFPGVRLIRGRVPDTLPQVDAERICYLSLDMNCAAPELAAAEFFWDRLVSGGVILSDDYGFTGFESQRKALDGFTAERGIQVMALPTGQGLIVKP